MKLGLGLSLPGVAAMGGKNRPYALLAGSAGSYISTPDAAVFDIAGDLTVVAHVAATDWTPAAAAFIAGKWGTTGNQRAYRLNLGTTGRLTLQWSPDGTATVSAAQSALLSLTDGARRYVAAELDVDNGAGGYTTTYYTSTDGLTWTQLSQDVTAGGTTSVNNLSTAAFTVGARLAAEGEHFTGKVFGARVNAGAIGAAAVFDWDLRRDGRTGDTSTASTGQVVTITGATYGTDPL